MQVDFAFGSADRVAQLYSFPKESQTDSGVTVTGEEYAYFDSRMAFAPKATWVKSPNSIDKERSRAR